jgi:hypothetical protein
METRIVREHGVVAAPPDCQAFLLIS